MAADPPGTRSVLSPDRRTLTVWREEPGGTRRTEIHWPTPATDEQLDAARHERSLPAMQVGQGRRTRRLRIGRAWIYLHHEWGPPVWHLPRLLISRRNGLVVGWRTHCFGVSVHAS